MLSTLRDHGNKTGSTYVNSNSEKMRGWQSAKKSICNQFLQFYKGKTSTLGLLGKRSQMNFCALFLRPFQTSETLFGGILQASSWGREEGRGLLSQITRKGLTKTQQLKNSAVDVPFQWPSEKTLYLFAVSFCPIVLTPESCGPLKVQETGRFTRHLSFPHRMTRRKTTEVGPVACDSVWEAFGSADCKDLTVALQSDFCRIELLYSCPGIQTSQMARSTSQILWSDLANRKAPDGTFLQWQAVFHGQFLDVEFRGWLRVQENWVKNMSHFDVGHRPWPRYAEQREAKKKKGAAHSDCLLDNLASVTEKNEKLHCLPVCTLVCKFIVQQSASFDWESDNPPRPTHTHSNADVHVLNTMGMQWNARAFVWTVDGTFSSLRAANPATLAERKSWCLRLGCLQPGAASVPEMGTSKFILDILIWSKRF